MNANNTPGLYQLRGSGAVGLSVKLIRASLPQWLSASVLSIPGHKESGMVGKITVKGVSAAQPTAASLATAQPTAAHAADDHGGPLPLGDIELDPNAPPYTLYNASAPQVAVGTVHEITLTTEEL
jgi:hypothetical protein